MELYELYQRAMQKGYRLWITQSHLSWKITIDFHKQINKEMVSGTYVFNVKEFQNRDVFLEKYKRAEREFLQKVAEYGHT